MSGKKKAPVAAGAVVRQHYPRVWISLCCVSLSQHAVCSKLAARLRGVT